MPYFDEESVTERPVKKNILEQIMEFGFGVLDFISVSPLFSYGVNRLIFYSTFLFMFYWIFFSVTPHSQPATINTAWIYISSLPLIFVITGFIILLAVSYFTSWFIPNAIAGLLILLVVCIALIGLGSRVICGQIFQAVKALFKRFARGTANAGN